MGEGHGGVGLVGGVAEHDALVAGADIELVLANVDAAGNVGGLLVDADEDLAVVAGEALGLHGGKVVLEGVEADLADLVADDLLVIEVGGGGDLAEDHDHVVLGGGLAGDLGERVGLEARIEDGVRHLVGKLVGVAFIDRLRGEKEVALFADHGCCCC